VSAMTVDDITQRVRASAELNLFFIGIPLYSVCNY
jgi:hypothetical protein